MTGAKPYIEASMLNMIAGAAAQTAESRLSTNPTSVCPAMVLCSRIAGRERWYVDALEDNPRLAAAVEVVLRSEDGILDAHANPLTGRVLVRYRPELPSESVEATIRRAVEFGPMSQEEFSSFQSNKAPATRSFHHLLAAEAACCAVNMVVLGEFCPFVLGAIGLHLLMHRHA